MSKHLIPDEDEELYVTCREKLENAFRLHTLLNSQLSAILGKKTCLSAASDMVFLYLNSKQFDPVEDNDFHRIASSVAKFQIEAEDLVLGLEDNNQRIRLGKAISEFSHSWTERLISCENHYE
eukprot:TRINITY_DN1821_c0_g2_i1.p1 TRINITY_DN1821_c0_g2~~TRINITY_DN1821_c0_g2_i1.p1  ORF type:complete len:123 (-),score=23.62 TRINITY_DN1821_c0_g2_i1:72-440(-)